MVFNMPAELTQTYLRIRVRSPTAFKKDSFKTDDIGRPGHSKRVAGILKKTGKWATQTWLINRKDLKKRDPKAWRLLRDIMREYPKTKASVSRALKKL